MSDELKVVGAELFIHLSVECPGCEAPIDLMDPHDTHGYDHNDCGEILADACPGEGHWSDSHKDFKLEDVTCTLCRTTFNVAGIDW